jgi:hypothetical protein
MPIWAAAIVLLTLISVNALWAYGLMGVEQEKQASFLGVIMFRKTMSWFDDPVHTLQSCICTISHWHTASAGKRCTHPRRAQKRNRNSFAIGDIGNRVLSPRRSGPPGP